VSQAAAFDDAEPQTSSYSPGDRSKFAGTFDRLVDSNLRLTESNASLAGGVKDLVRAVYVALGLGLGMGAVGVWSLLHTH